MSVSDVRKIFCHTTIEYGTFIMGTTEQSSNVSADLGKKTTLLLTSGSVVVSWFLPWFFVPLGFKFNPTRHAPSLPSDHAIILLNKSKLEYPWKKQKLRREYSTGYQWYGARYNRRVKLIQHRSHLFPAFRVSAKFRGTNGRVSCSSS